MPKNTAKARRNHAVEYGWAMSVLRSNKGLWHIFNQSVKNDWAPERFVAEVRKTKWFRHHSDSWRKNLILKKTDPHTYHQRLVALRESMADQAQQMGASGMPDGTLYRFAQNAMAFGWNDAQVRNHLAGQVRMGKDDHFAGEAYQHEQQIREYARANGISISRNQLNHWVRGAAQGSITVEDAKAWVQNHAESAFPALARDIRAGQNVIDIAAPYIQSMGNIWEINPNEINLFEPKLRRALQNRDPDSGKEPKATPLWQFEQSLRQDDRWLKTQNAQDQLMGVGRQVLRDFGLSA